ncbi:MAG: hypothetical protein ABR887_02870 [Methanoregulaceae archaeon]
MLYCKDCISFKSKSKDNGECRINGDVPADRESDRCPSRTFIPRSAK